MNSQLNDVLNFKKMITPVAVQILFWLFVLFLIIGGLMTALQGQPAHGLMMIFIAPIVLRIYAELIMVIFRIHEGIEKLVDK